MRVNLYIDGTWAGGSTGSILPIIDPATEETIGELACAMAADLDRTLQAAKRGFAVWRSVSAFERCKIMRAAAEIMRQRAIGIAHEMSREQGKPVAEAKREVLAGADTIDWFAEEGKRAYGRTIPPRSPDVQQIELREPVGPVAAFSPWNFPVNQAVRKISAALAAGCSMIIKGPEETPASCAALVDCFGRASLPAGVLNLVFGVPSDISSHLIADPIIKKVSFTGSTSVGRHIAAMAGQHMKRLTLELGGHAPAIVCADADLDQAADILASNKFRNAGQVCVSPTRIMVECPAFDTFVRKFVANAEAVKVGNGQANETTMGPLANVRRLEAMTSLVADAVAHGAKLQTGGKRVGNRGYFFAPTVLTDVPKEARIMNEEPFGPVAILNRFDTLDEAFAEANRLEYGLAAYAYSTSASTISKISRSVESGMISVNHHGLGLPEVPFGGIKDSGYGTEGGAEALANYMNVKFVTVKTN